MSRQRIKNDIKLETRGIPILGHVVATGAREQMILVAFIVGCVGPFMGASVRACAL